MTQEFGAESTTDEVLAGVDLSGKTCLVTGVSAGLGVETARALAAHGAHVIGAARDLTKARAATAQIQNPPGAPGGFELIELDLASLASVRNCAASLLAAGRTLDIMIANAGIMACPQGTTVDGFETQFATNHLGHFVLINHITSLLRPGSRVVNLSSLGHRGADVDLDDPNFERTEYNEFVAYGRSKTANILFTVELDRRYKPAGIRAIAVHPGGIQTELNRYTPAEVTEKLIASINAQRAPETPPFTWKPSRRVLLPPSGPPSLPHRSWSAGCTAKTTTSRN
jgi:NAD(P)-dependent dehydrogenase (short-subunit alcohol dehydrogenase family)